MSCKEKKMSIHQWPCSYGLQERKRKGKASIHIKVCSLLLEAFHITPFLYEEFFFYFTYLELVQIKVHFIVSLIKGAQGTAAQKLIHDLSSPAKRHKSTTKRWLCMVTRKHCNTSKRDGKKTMLLACRDDCTTISEQINFKKCLKCKFSKFDRIYGKTSQDLRYLISTIRCIMKYIFIIFLFDVINIVDLFYKFGQT